jgi:aminoglycoside/choline kinase family phosphotransferase
MALQRQLKALGIFVRLKLKDHRGTHIKDIPPVLQHVVDIARQYDELGEFGQWLIDVVQPAVTAHPALQP